jgi:hypothetical protein
MQELGVFFVAIAFALLLIVAIADLEQIRSKRRP